MDRFLHPLQVELQPDRKRWRLLTTFSYIDPEHDLVTVPSGFETDFASVPRWPLTFSLLGQYGHAAAVLHDWLYSTGKLARADADRVFLNALRSSGIARWRSWLMWSGVRVGGSSYYMKLGAKMPITEQQLLQIMPSAKPVVGVFVPALNRAMARYDIDSNQRQAAFLAQIGHESGHLRRMVENLNYSAGALVKTWPSRFADAAAAEYARKPEMIANKVYGGRMGNGPEASGDGWRYRGRGLLQVTGRDNYSAVGAALDLSLIDQPELLEQPDHAAMSAAWWWHEHGLNGLADAGKFQDIGSIINTGKPGRVPHGAADRKALYDAALKVMA